MAHLGNQETDEMIKTQNFSIARSFSSKDVFFQLSMQYFFVEKYPFENLDSIINDVYGNFGRSRMRSKKNIRTTGSLLGTVEKFSRNQKNRAIASQIELRKLKDLTRS